MTIFTNGSTFAIGKAGGLAKYVVRSKGGKVTGVRGRRPKLDDRYKVAKKVSAAIKAALTENA